MPSPFARNELSGGSVRLSLLLVGDGILPAIVSQYQQVFLANSLASCLSTSLPSLSRHLQDGSVNARGLTMRAADKWDSPRFSGRFLASSKVRQTGVVSAHPLAANAGRWVASCKTKTGY